MVLTFNKYLVTYLYDCEYKNKTYIHIKLLRLKGVAINK